MLAKWKRTVRVLATTTVLLVYLTAALFGDPALEGAADDPRPPPTASDSGAPSVRTLVAYSQQFTIRRHLQDTIRCDAPRGGDSPRGSGWAHDPRLGIRAFSAFHDSRQHPQHYVRVVALVRRNSSFYCQLCHRDNGTLACVTRRALAQEVWSPQWGPKGSPCDREYPAIITCLAPPEDAGPPPSLVSFVDRACEGGAALLSVSRPPPPPRRARFVVCVKPLDLGGLRAGDLEEWVEINVRLGAEKIVFYGGGGQGARAVGGGPGGRAVEWREFAAPQRRQCAPRSFGDSVWHKRKMEIIAYNDCFYSNLYYTKFVIPLDVDEIIVPKTGNDWVEAFRSHFGGSSGGGPWPAETDKYASFSVRNAYFFGEYPKDATLVSAHPHPPRPPPNPASAPPDTFARTLRSFRLSPNADSVKSFVHVDTTLSVFNHYAFHVLREGVARQLILPETVFQLNHYRDSCDPLLIDGCRHFLDQVVYDHSLERFRSRRRLSLRPHAL